MKMDTLSGAASPTTGQTVRDSIELLTDLSSLRRARGNESCFEALTNVFRNQKHKTTGSSNQDNHWPRKLT
jgi:hypothetical protein